jgi:hypothetical protein
MIGWQRTKSLGKGCVIAGAQCGKGSQVIPGQARLREMGLKAESEGGRVMAKR